MAHQKASHIRGSARGTQRSEFQFDPAPQWDGTPPDKWQQKYLDTALAAEVKKVSQAKDGGRKDALNVAALKCGHYIAGAGMNQDKVIDALMGAAEKSGLVDDDGEMSAKATIRSGLRAGKKTPRAVPPPQDKQDRKTHMEGRTVRLIPITTVTDDVPEWAWVYGGKGRIQRGTLTLFGGRPGAGKSTSLRWLATQFSLGLAEGCWYGKPQNVAYIAAAEESLRYIVKPGLRAAGADMSRIFFPEVESDGKEVRLSALADEEALTGALLGERHHGRAGRPGHVHHRGAGRHPPQQRDPRTSGAVGARCRCHQRGG